jgi:two-component system, chemotaxis family, protein-glutamate methylesterase/glutaminase
MMPRQSIIVLGASAGGLGPLRQILSQLPPDLPASLFVVVHLPPQASVDLVDGLCGSCRLPVQWANDREAFREGRIYLAPPNRHLLVKQDHVRVLFGARENRVRPAIDVLFRSAAVEHRSRVVGVVLSGYLDDGAAGLSIIQQCGGITIVQNPAEAEVASMPLEAIARTESIDFRLDATEIAEVLSQLARAEARPAPAIPDPIRIEAALAENTMTTTHDKSSPLTGTETVLTCPDCGGALWELHDGVQLRFRCRVGHAFTTGRLLHAMENEIEQALWLASRVLRERADLLKKLAASSVRERPAADFDRRAEEVLQQVHFVEDVLARIMTHREFEAAPEPPSDDSSDGAAPG